MTLYRVAARKFSVQTISDCTMESAIKHAKEFLTNGWWQVVITEQ